ncbi:MAG: hypothetical protein WAN46_11305 [Gammaproteobacteria bacterium]
MTEIIVATKGILSTTAERIADTHMTIIAVAVIFPPGYLHHSVRKQLEQTGGVYAVDHNEKPNQKEDRYPFHLAKRVMDIPGLGIHRATEVVQ